MFEDVSPGEFLLLRERLGMGWYIKVRERDESKRELLMRLWLATLEEREKDDYVQTGFRKRKLAVK